MRIVLFATTFSGYDQRDTVARFYRKVSNVFSSYAKRRGLMLVELLVVMAIIGILIALILPDCPGDNGSVYGGHDSDTISWAGDNNEEPTGPTAKVDNVDYCPLRDETHSTAETTDWGTGEKWGESNFGSMHLSGCYFVMCDGSVQTIGYAIDARINFRLANRHDGRNVQLSN